MRILSNDGFITNCCLLSKFCKRFVRCASQHTSCETNALVCSVEQGMM